MPHKELALGTPMSRLSTVFHTRRLFLVLYSIFSLGLDSAGNRKRIVGQVTVSGKHQRMFAEKQILCLSVQYNHRWETQFSAGLR